MIYDIPDVDIDVKNRKEVVSLFPDAIVGSQLQQDDLVLHKSGIYLQNIPVDPETGLSAYPYDIAEDLGYFKIDLIPNHIYDRIETEDQLQELLNREVDWDWFLDPRFFEDEAPDDSCILTHLGRYHNLCVDYTPSSVEDIAILISVIRPRKKYLIGRDWTEIENKIWKKLDGEQSYFFKKSHGIAFALLVIVHAQLIAQSLSD